MDPKCKAPTGSPRSGTAPAQWDDLAEAARAPLPPRVDHPAALPPADARLLLFAGKGGVGKTTLACATALRLVQERPGKSLLLFSADPAHSLSDCLETPIGPRETPICPGLVALEIDAEAEFEQLKAEYVQEVGTLFGSLAGGAALDMAFDRVVIERMMDLSPPGLDEIMALTRAMGLLSGRRYETLVVDAPPTGHLVRLLELPQLIQEWLRLFFDLLLKYRNVLRVPRIADLLVTVSRNTTALRSVLADPAQGQLYAVGVLTEAALAETHDLLAACRRAGLYVPALFLNLATAPCGCALCDALARAESGVRRQFEETCRGLHQAVVYRCGGPRGTDRLGALGRALYAERTP